MLLTVIYGILNYLTIGENMHNTIWSGKNKTAHNNVQDIYTHPPIYAYPYIHPYMYV